MTFRRVRSVLVLLAVLLTVACSTSPTTEAAPRAEPSTPAVNAGEQALAAYEEFWAVANAALAAPGSRDWTPRLESVATDQALQTLSADVANYADLPAHIEGTLTRDPVLDVVTTDRVKIVDCIDLGDSRLVSDTTGEVLDDLVNRVPRYRFRAEVVDVGDRWLVERTAPALDEPC